MPKIDFKLIPALLGWLFLLLIVGFVAAMFIPSAHAADTFLGNAASPAAGTDCAPHKGLFGFQDGWDCIVPQYTNTLTLTTDPGNVWCTRRGAECKTAGDGALQINGTALASLDSPRRFEIALDCIARAGQPDAHCKVAIKSETAK